MFLPPDLPCTDSVADDGVMVIIEWSGPCQEHRSAGYAGYHGPVGRWFWSILHHQLDWAGVQTIVNETVVHPSVLHSDWSKLQAIPVLVQSSPEGIVPLGDLVIVPQQPQTII